MANDLEQRARELFALQLDEASHHTEADNVRRGIDLESYAVELRAVEAALQQAQQPINGDVESSKAAAVPSVDGGPGNYVALASPPSQQPGAQAVAFYMADMGGGFWADTTRELYEHWHAKDPAKVRKLYTAPPPLPEGVSEDLLTIALEANDLCRSAHAVAERVATQYATVYAGTNFGALHARLNESLERQHKVLAPHRDRLARKGVA